MNQNNIFQFPSDFLWGAANSSHQIEGNNAQNDWWRWEQQGKVPERSGNACDHWNRFREDFALAKSIGHNAHRFSLEWSRIEPREGEFNEQALTQYLQMLSCLQDNGLEPIVTLHHFTLPAWLADKGGWLSDDAPGIFARYAHKVAEILGEKVRFWITLNEPMVYVFKSYMIGQWPPGEQSYEKSLKVLSHLLKGHVLAYDALKEVNQDLDRPPINVGIAKHVLVFSPCSPRSWRDRISVWARNIMFNHLFVQGLINGRIFYPGLFSIRLSKAKTLDFIGLNYYTRDFVHHKGLSVPSIFGDICTLDHHADAGKRNFLKWEIYPKGLYCMVKEFSHYRLPILITENGICTSNDGERWQFIVEHLRQLAVAIKEGIPVIGYMYWSLLDNYEWADGFTPRFGLIEVDYLTQNRRVRESAKRFGTICRSHQLDKGKKVLFVCIHNSARSQMAEALLNHLAPDRFHAMSAGTDPGNLNPRAIDVMKEIGIDISFNKTKSVADFVNSRAMFDYVITLCDETNAERCPQFPGASRKIHWSFADPSSFTGSLEDKLTKTRQVRDEIKEKIQEWLKARR